MVIRIFPILKTELQTHPDEHVFGVLDDNNISGQGCTLVVDGWSSADCHVSTNTKTPENTVIFPQTFTFPWPTS